MPAHASAFLPAPAPTGRPLQHALRRPPALGRRAPTARPRAPAQTPPVLTLSPSRPRSALRGSTNAHKPQYPAPPPADRSQRVRVEIHAPARNRRVIAASNLIHAPLPIVWALLSDYARLADHIPNLQLSRVRPHPRGGIRLEQCGAQNILGFTFRASLVMDMVEESASSESERAIAFSLVSSPDFTAFDGEWRMVAVAENKTELFYIVDIVPKGMVPVRAIEWRVSEDVPGNMDAVRTECERRRRTAVAARRQGSISEQQLPPPS